MVGGSAKQVVDFGTIRDVVEPLGVVVIAVSGGGSDGGVGALDGFFFCGSYFFRRLVM